MKLSLNWLRELVDVEKISAEKIGEKLTLHTAELEELISRKSFFENVFVGKLLAVRSHKNSDKLHVGQFDFGKKLPKKQIIFGSVHELTENKIYPVALDGARLASGIEISETELRGEKSAGMVCDNSELGMKNNGVLEFDEKFLGSALSEISDEFCDTVLDIDNKSLTHRPDLLGHRGFARELGAIFDRKISFPEPKISFPKTGKKVPVEIQTENCRRFCAAKISNISVENSALKKILCLENLGIRAISNIVDATNLILLEFGQPMHAFDASKISGKIIVRQAKKGEKLLALDGETYELSPADVVIADEKKVLSIAGIMGGEDSAVTAETTEIIFESANFDAATIRRTSARLGLRSESSMRFEKSLDPEMCVPALRSACAQVLEFSPAAKISAPITDVFPHPFEPLVIQLDPELIRARSGLSISNENIQKYLTALGFSIAEKKKKILVDVPSWRNTKDVSIPEDLIEEVVRLYGFENIVSILPTLPMDPPRVNKLRRMEWHIRNFLAARGFLEVYHSSFVSPDDLTFLQTTPEKYVTTSNAPNEEYTFLRRTLVSNFVRHLEPELRVHRRVDFFEIGKVYQPEFSETQKLTLFSAEIGVDAVEKFYRFKAKLFGVFSAVAVDPEMIHFVPCDNPCAISHPTRCSEIFVGGTRIGILAQLHPVKNPVKNSVAIFAEIDLEQLQKSERTTGQHYVPVSSYPVSRRDLSVVVDRKTLVADLETVAFSAAQNLEKMELFDEFEDEKKLGLGQKNLAFHLEFRSSKQTLTEKMVESEFRAIVKNLEKEFSAKLRLDFSAENQ